MDCPKCEASGLEKQGESIKVICSDCGGTGKLIGSETVAASEMVDAADDKAPLMDSGAELSGSSPEESND